MGETHKTENGLKVPEFLREPLVAAQARLGHLEDEAQRVLKEIREKGRASRKDLEQMVARLSRQDWTFPEVKQRLDKLREQGVERATEWRGKAESFRSEALERMLDLQSRAVSFLGVATREQVDELSKELERLARRLERGERGRRSKRPTKSSSTEA